MYTTTKTLTYDKRKSSSNEFFSKNTNIEQNVEEKVKTISTLHLSYSSYDNYERWLNHGSEINK